MKKNILFYIPSNDQKSGGTRQYAFNLLKMISEVPNDDFNFFIYNIHNDPLFEVFKEDEEKFTFVKVNDKKALRRYKRIKIAYKILRFISFGAFKKKILRPHIEELIISEYKIDIIHSPFQTLPIITKGIKSISTMHDVQELHFPEFFVSKERMDRAINNYNLSINSDRIIVSFDHIKQDITNFFQLEQSKVQTFLISLNYLWIIDFYNDNKKSFLVEDYLIYPANGWIHKNHIRLLEAIYYLKNQGKKVKLMFTGDFNIENGTLIKNKIVELGLSDYVQCKGVVSQQELFELYMRAKAVVIPTLYEAGSYPLYEAIALEKPVICSNVTSLPETMNNDKFIFDPKNILDMASKIESIYFDENFIKDSIENSKSRKSILANNNSVEKLYKVYSEL